MNDLADLPAGWSWSRFDEIGSISLGRQRSPANHAGPSMRPYVRAANITWTGWNLTDVKEMNFNDADFARFRLKSGDVLVNEGSGSAAEVGKPAIWRGEISDCCFQNTLLRVQPKACTPEFVFNYISLCAKSGQFVESTQGVNIFHIGREGLARQPIPVPPMPEQRRIVAKIDNLLVKSKRARNRLDHIPKLVGQYKAAILAAAFAGKLTTGWRTATKKDWIPTTVGQISEITSGYGFPKEHQGKQNGDFPFAKVSDISRAVAEADGRLSKAANYIDATGLRALRARLVPAGSTVFAKIGEALRLNRRALTQTELVLDNNCMAVTPLKEQVDPEFLYRFMATIDLNPFAVATAVPSVRRGDVASVVLRLPPMDEQQEIVHRIDTGIGWIERLAAEATSARTLINRLDQAVLAKAFRGELVPQDPADEAASVLLKRIRAEKCGRAT